MRVFPRYCIRWLSTATLWPGWPGVGVLINGFTAWLFIDVKNRDLNVKGAYLHMAADALVSIGVVISGIVIHFTDST